MDRKESVRESRPRTPAIERSRNAPSGLESATASRAELVPGSNSASRRLVANWSTAGLGSGVIGAEVESLPWSAAALSAFRQRMQPREFALLEAGDDPVSARLDAVFSLPPELWPVLPPGALYCLEDADPRVGFAFLQNSDFPEVKVRLSTYYGKWCRDKVDFVVAWQPPRAAMGSAWSAGSGPPPPVLPWEARQVLAHTTSGEYQYARTRLRFRGAASALLAPEQRPVEYCDVHGVDHADTKAAHEGAGRNSDKDRDAHLLDPPKPNTWGEHARRPLIGRLRSGGGGVYMHHVMYDYSGLRTSCGRRVPAGYFFTLAPSASPTPAPTPPPGQPVPTSAAAAATAGVVRPASAASARPSALRPASAPRARRPAGAPLSASVSWLDQAPAGGGGGGAAAAAGHSSRTLRSSVSAGNKSVASAAVRGPSPAASAAAAPSALALSRSASGAGASAAAAAAEAPVAVSPPGRWRTYGVPFSHPIHRTRAGELAAWVAASGEGEHYRAFSDTAAVMKVAEAHLRLPRAFVPSPLVVPGWADVPRMYAEHMAAAAALMSESDEDAGDNMRLHVMLHHLQHAATLEYDRLDAKLALLPQMARLGRKSAEIDAWLQVIVAHATYLYATLQITNTHRWPQARLDPARSAALLSTAGGAASAMPAPAAGPIPDPLAPGLPAPAAATTSLPGAAGGSPRLPAQPGTPPAAWQPLRPPFASSGLDSQPSLPLALLGLQGADGGGGGGVSIGGGLSIGGGISIGGGGPLPRPYVSLDEWAAVTRIMDTCRHAELYEQWVRLRPLMNGTARPGAYSLSRHASALLLPTTPAEAEAEAAAGAAAEALRPASSEPFADGPMNVDLLGYLSADMDAMSRPGYDPPPPPLADFPPPRGFRGVGPPPPPRRGPVPAPVRCRGPEETPLPEEVAASDVWHEKTRAGQVTPRLASPERPGPERADPGAVRHGQSAVKRLQAAKQWAQSRQADVQRAMRSARGLPSPEYVWGPGDPASAEGQLEPDGAGGDEDDCDTESVMSGATGLTSSTARSGSTWGRQRSREGAAEEGGAASSPSCRAPRPRHAPGTGTQTAPRFWEPSEAEAAAAAARARAAADAEVARQLVLSGNAKSREQILDEALAAAEAAIASLSPRPPAANTAPQPSTRSTADHYHNLTAGTAADPSVAYTFERRQSAAPVNTADAVWKRLRYGWYGRDGDPVEDGSAAGDGGGGGGGGGGDESGGGLQQLDPSTHKLQGQGQGGGRRGAELQSVEVARKRGLEEYGLGTGIISGFGIVDYETAMARRRAISLATTAHETRRNLSRGEVLDLFVTFCNLANRQEMVAELRHALTRPVSATAVTAATAAALGRAGITSAEQSASGGYPAPAAAGAEPAEADPQRQRIRVTAWLLGVTWRRISNETYASFVCRVLGWPPDLAASLPRTRATHIVARALVRGHDMADVPAPPARI